MTHPGANYPIAPPTVQPAIDTVDRAIAKATKKNSGPVISKLNQVRDQLTYSVTTGQPLPIITDPVDLLNRKRGIGDLINSWTDNEKRGVQETLPGVYRALDKELDRTVPGADVLNQRISSLIPVGQRASRLTRNAGLGQRIVGRIGAHTGALAGLVGGGLLGYQQGGMNRALEYGAAGAALPELAVSPSTQMAAARLAQSQIPLRFIKALALQLDRPSPEQAAQSNAGK
jgi:hypothetical protein